MGFFVPIIYILLATATLVIILKQKFGKCLPITLLGSTVVLFLSQILFNTFKIGLYVNWAFALSSIVLIISMIIRKKTDDFKKNFFTTGFWATVIIYFFIYIFDFKRSFTRWDEFSHWGVMVKEMLRLDKFYIVDASTLMVHKEYPPIIQLFEMFWVQLSGGTFSEARVIRAFHFLELSFFIPFLEMDKEKGKTILKTIAKTISLAFIVLLTLLFFDDHTIMNTIYVDYMLSILVAYGIAVVFIDKGKLTPITIISLTLSLLAVLLTKQIGITLYAMTLFLLAGILVLNNLKSKIKIDKKLIAKAFIVLVCLIGIPFAGYKYWSNATSNLSTTKQFDISNIEYDKLMGILENTEGEKYQQKAANNYRKAIKTQKITTSYISLTYVQAIVLGLALLYFVYKLTKDKYEKKNMYLLFTTIIIGAIGYAFVMLNMYIFCFDSREGPALASYDRYMSTFALIIFFVSIILYFYKNEKLDKSAKKVLLITTALFLLQSPVNLDSAFPFIIKPKEDIAYEMHANNIREYNVQTGDKIFQIAQDTNSEYQYFVHYYISDTFMNEKLFSFNVSDDVDPVEWFNENVKEYMLKFDYVYIAKVNDQFKEKYSFLFEDEIIPQKMYTIEKENDTVVLKLIDNDIQEEE